MLPHRSDDVDDNNPFFQSILFSIRNTQRLTSVQSHYLYLCSFGQLIKIIQGYNELINYLIDVIMLDDE